MEFINYLIAAAKQGNTRSYLELCQFYGKQIFQLIYQLHPDKKQSQKITIDVFLKTWENIQRYKNEADFSRSLRETALRKSLLYDVNEKNELLGDDGFEHDLLSLKHLVFSRLENSFLELPLPEKVSFKLYDDLGLDFEKISKFLKLDNSDAAKELVIYSIRVLAHFNGFNNLANLNYKQMTVLLDKIKYEAVEFDIISEEHDKSILKEYKELNNKLHSSFENVEVPEDLAEIIYEKIQILENELKSKELIELELKERKQAKSKSESPSRTKAFLKKVFNPSKWPLVADPWKRRAFFNRTVPILLAVLLIYYFLFLNRFNGPWLISHATGKYKINGAVSNSTSLSENDIILTGTDVSLALGIPATADIKIFSDTELQIVQPIKNDNIFKLTKGEIELETFRVSGDINEITDNTNIIVQTPFGSLKTESAAVKITMLENNSCKIQLSRGWAEFLFTDETVYLASGYILFVDQSTQYRIPFDINTSEVIERTIIEQNFPIDYSRVQEIVHSAEKQDILTLLHLLKYTDKLARENIIEYIRKFVPFIDEKVKYKLKNLDEEYYKELAMFIRIQLVH